MSSPGAGSGEAVGAGAGVDPAEIVARVSALEQVLGTWTALWCWRTSMLYACVCVRASPHVPFICMCALWVGVYMRAHVCVFEAVLSSVCLSRDLELLIVCGSLCVRVR